MSMISDEGVAAFLYTYIPETLGGVPCLRGAATLWMRHIRPT